MGAMNMDHASMDMAGMNMSDCPNTKAGMMKMDTGKCAMSCYGLVTSILMEIMPTVADALAVEAAPKAHPNLTMPSRALGVPTPPPNFA